MERLWSSLRLRKWGQSPPRFKGQPGPGRDSVSPRDHWAPPPPGSQGLPGQDRSRLSSRPGASRRPPTPRSWAGTPFALLPGRRAGPSSAILRTVGSAPPTARPRDQRCACGGLAPSRPPPPSRLFRDRPVNNTRTCRPAPVAIGISGILRDKGRGRGWGPGPDPAGA